jgi:CRISPR-associated protein Cas5d
MPDQAPNTAAGPAIYAHTLPGQPQSAWETLDAHAANVARRAREFAAPFGTSAISACRGRWLLISRAFFCESKQSPYIDASMQAPYVVALEIAGPIAMFARPDTGATPTSYPVPTWSACKGIFESVARLGDSDAWITPTKVEICRRAGEAGGTVRFQRYTTNYGGPLRKANQIREQSSFQFFATVLADVCYRIYGVVDGAPRAARGAHNPRHFLQDLFHRRIRQGRCHRTPCLGWSEFTASYWGPFRDGLEGQPLVSEVDDALNLSLTSLLHSVFDKPTAGRYAPRFMHQVTVERGVLILDDVEEASASRAS